MAAQPHLHSLDIDPQRTAQPSGAAPTRPPIRSLRFRQEREAEWRELDGMVARAIDGGLSRLKPGELIRLPKLYRNALSSLGVARATSMDRALLNYLESLSARAYLVVYASRRKGNRPMRTFFGQLFPAQVRALWPELALSGAVFALGVAIAFSLTVADPIWYGAFVDSELASGRSPFASTAELRKPLYDSGDALSVFASFLFTHNARIGMLAFALGFAGGIPTAILLFTNGLMLGAFAAAYAQHGLLLPFMGWLLPHGVPEILAVLLCGAAGLHIGRAVVYPGARRVRDALLLAGRDAAVVVAGAVVLFAYAGLIEGVFRQVVHDDGARFAMALFNAFWIALWLLWGGRRQTSAK